SAPPRRKRAGLNVRAEISIEHKTNRPRHRPNPRQNESLSRVMPSAARYGFSSSDFRSMNLLFPGPAVESREHKGSPKEERMNSTKKTARIAGVLYLVNALTGFFGIIYVPGRLIVSGDPAATANNILASEKLFRLGIASELICAVEFVFLFWV